MKILFTFLLIIAGLLFFYIIGVIITLIQHKTINLNVRDISLTTLLGALVFITVAAIGVVFNLAYKIVEMSYQIFGV